MLLNFMLTILWLLLTGVFSSVNLFIGFILSYIILLLTSSKDENEMYFSKLPQALFFIFFLLKEIALANFQLAKEIITPGHKMHPGIIEFRLSCKSDFEIALLANLISITPGTLSLNVSDDKKFLYIHAMYLKDVPGFIYKLKTGYEKRVIELLK